MAKKRSSSKMADKNGSPPASFKYEVILWAVLAVSIILFISSFGIAGKAGNFISSIIFGLFGFPAYLFPFLLFGGTAFAIANKDNAVAVRKEAAAAGFFIFVCMFLELVGGSAQAENPLDSYLWAAEHKSGGGLTGGILTWLIKPNLGTISAFVIDIIMMIICMVLVTQRSLWKPIQSGGRKMYTTAKKETIRQREQYEQRKLRRMDNKVSGVSADTSIKNAVKNAVSDNINEIRPDSVPIPDFPIYMMNQQPASSKASAPRASVPKASVPKAPHQAQEVPETIPKSQAAGMEYADVMPFPAAKAKPESPDNIVPIKNKKVVLKPSFPDEEVHNTAAGQNDADIFLEQTGSIFSGLLPETEALEHMPPEAGWNAQEELHTKMPEAFQETLADAEVMQSEPAQNESGILSSAWNGIQIELPQNESEISSGLRNGIQAELPQNGAEILSENTWDGIQAQVPQDEPEILSEDAWNGMQAGMPQNLPNMQADVRDAENSGILTEGFGIQEAETELNFDSMDFFGIDLQDLQGKPERNSSLEQSPGEGRMPGGAVSDTQEPDIDFDAPAMTAEELIAQQLLTAETAPVKSSVSAAQTSSADTQTAGKGAGQRKNPKQSQAQMASSAADIAVQLHQPKPVIRREYVLPSPDLLKRPDPNQTGDSREHLQETALKLQQTLKNFGVNVTILNVSCGPSVTRYEIQPEMGVKVSKIVNLADDIKLNLAAADIRIEAPIPGKAAIGIEVPNKETVPVMFRELVESEAFKKHPSPCAFAAGKDIAGQTVVTDICKMPHVLIAGATGSGKSVCINTIIMSIIYKASPDDVKLIMIDPKVVELSVYNGIPHLLLPVVTDPKKAAGALHWAVSEMMDRYQKFADYGVRDMKGYNAKIKKIADIPDENKPQKMPYIVIIVDELADLMMAAPGDVEDAICRLAQLARAAGIHLIIATQRPSVNVITGLIKANMPSRIAFSVTSGIDSRTILDMNGAEKLLGKGDMLFYPQGLPKPVRMQGAFVSDSEVSDVVEFLTAQNGASSYSTEIQEKVANAASQTGSAQADSASGDERDVYFADAARLLMDKEKASVSMLQRYFKIGFNRAARIMDQLEEAGVVGPEEGTKPRKILMSPEQFAQYEEEVL